MKNYTLYQLLERLHKVKMGYIDKSSITLKELTEMSKRLINIQNIINELTSNIF